MAAKSGGYLHLVDDSWLIDDTDVSWLVSLVEGGVLDLQRKVQ